MELKKYQQRVIADLQAYLEQLNATGSLSEAFERYWLERQIQVGLGGISAYQNIIEGVPHVCYKVPTGGGKTLLACASLEPIFRAMPPTQTRAVVWLVPSDSILTQTLAALKNPQHPYRQRLNVDFSGRVEIYSKEELLAGQNFSPATVDEQLSVMVLSYDSFRARSKDGRKAYQPNGALEPFRGRLAASEHSIEDADETALFEVINRLNPVVVVDESHHARSTLSLEMLTNFNPSFVLDLTATPTKESNIISYVDALALKAEHMVKLPVVVYNRSSQTEVITDAIDWRNVLERAALEEQKQGGDYIRPIVLFQAQPKNKEDATSFEKLKVKLTDAGISEEEIAIKTASVDELKGVDLLSPKCPVRYIITVNALKEGWDCPFAYVLASLANKTSRVDVEQILGRILRQPNTHKHGRDLLNMSYVMASSSDFQQTVDDVISGLNAAGFTGREYRIAEELPEQIAVEEETYSNGRSFTPPEEDASKPSSDIPCEDEEEFLDFDATKVASTTHTPSNEEHDDERLGSMISQASQLGDQYEQEAKAATANTSAMDIPNDLEDQVKRYPMVEAYRDRALGLRVPQFYYRMENSLFESEDDVSWSLLAPDYLNEGFTLRGKDSTLDVSRALEQMVSVDVRDANSDTPKAFTMNQTKQQQFLRYLDSLPEERRANQATEALFAQLDRKNNAVASKDLRTYVRRVVENLDPQQLKQLESSLFNVANQLNKKIDLFLKEYRAIRFAEQLKIGNIQARAEYRLPETIYPANASSNVGGSLYDAEGDMNKEERALIMRIASLDNIAWWHRIVERDKRAFFINGSFNHYPDFMVVTKRGNVLIVESKGEMLKNDDSRLKIELGRQWENAAGQNFHYFMVFKDGVTPLEHAYDATRFLNLIQQM